MAKFEMTGFDELVAEMKRLGELSGSVADEMLMAGAEQVKEAWRNSAQKHRLKDTGDMIDSIGYASTPKAIGDVRTIEIYPQGKDSKGVRNALKAYVLHYGKKGSTSKNAQRQRLKSDKQKGPGIPATHWVDDAERESGPMVMDAMTKIWDKHLEGL